MAMTRDVLWSPFIARGLFADFGRSGRHQYIVSATFTHLLHTEAWTGPLGERVAARPMDSMTLQPQ